MSGLEGRLFRWKTKKSHNLQAFETPCNHNFRKFCIFIGGLTDGLLACPYVEALALECEKKSFSLIQPVLGSSYIGYGTGSLQRDVDELECLVEHLRRERSAEVIAMVGHSTGCQDIVYFMKKANSSARNLVRVIALQAPCSDREVSGKMIYFCSLYPLVAK